MQKNSESVINLTTGPVFIPQDVLSIFGQKPASHRAPEFIEAFESLQQKVCKATGAPYVNFLTGSGTLANETMIAQVKRFRQKGLVLSNGEFGDRLADQCRKQQLNFITCSKSWGEEHDLGEIEQILKKDRQIQWMMLTYCESSTGCIADLPGITALGKKYGVKICLDAMSAIGNRPTDLSGVAFATASSGKGLGSFPGIALVFSADKMEPDPSLPTYIDLGHYFSKGGIPFTISSNLIMALNRAVDHTLQPGHISHIGELSAHLLNKIKGIPGIEVLNKNYRSVSHITTIIPQNGVSAVDLGNAIWKAGIETSFNSRYLVDRNYLQVAIMSRHYRYEIDFLLDVLGKEVQRLQQAGVATA